MIFSRYFAVALTIWAAKFTPLGTRAWAFCEKLYAMGIRAPWLMTGHRSVPDFMPYMPSGHDYRKHAPGSQPVTAIIPGDNPSLVYDIKYHVRDYRRNNKYVARTCDVKTPLDVDKMFQSAPLKPEDVKEVERPDMMPTRGW
jgi:hypothetical protein